MATKTGIIDPDLALQIINDDPNCIAYDTETTGLSVRDKICGYVVTNDEYSIYVPVRHGDGGNIPGVEDFEEQMAKAAKNRSRKGYRTVGHHLGFDLRASLRHGIVFSSPLEDTMINEALINDLTLGYSLEECASRRGVTPKKGEALYVAISSRFGGLADRKSMANFWKMPGDNPEVLDYATGDGVSTLELWRAQQPILDSEDLRKVWKLECDLLPYLARMHNRGLKVSEEYASNVMVRIKERIEEAQQKFTPGFNVRSSNELEALYRSHGFQDNDFAYTQPSAKKPNGQVSFTEKWLKTNQIGQNVIAVRQLEKARDSFILPLIDTHNVNGRVHPVLHQSKSDEYGVAGARLSCSEPNLQAYPKRNKEVGKTVRPLVEADKGMVIKEADFRQQEPRLFTHYSEEPDLIEGYNNGTMDMHDRASEVLEIPRDYAKRLGMGMLTMMSPKTLAGHMGYSLEEAERDHRRFLSEAFPLIGKFQRDVVSVFKSRGWVKSILGRKARLDQKWLAYQGVSRVIQNSGGDHMKTALLRANQYEDAHPDMVQILLSIHDSTLWQAVEEFDDSEMVRAIENVAHEPDFNLRVPIPVDLGVGKNWGEASYGK